MDEVYFLFKLAYVELLQGKFIKKEYNLDKFGLA